MKPGRMPPQPRPALSAKALSSNTHREPPKKMPPTEAGGHEATPSHQQYKASQESRPLLQ